MRALIVATLLLAGGVAAAQNIDEITVAADRIARTKLSVAAEPSLRMKKITLSYTVSVADLDLASSGGAAEMERRVYDAARAACRETGRLYPDATPDDETCVSSAVREAMQQGRVLVVAARKAAGQ